MASALLSEDSDSIALYPAAQAGVKILVIAYDIDRTANKSLQEVFSRAYGARTSSIKSARFIFIIIFYYYIINTWY
jgi:hypothetical protein